MLMLNDQTREALWRRLIAVIENYLTKVDSARVAPELDIEKIRGALAGRDFAEPARASGLGTAAVREIPVDDDLRMKVDELTDRIERDRAEGFKPLMIVATAGTTSAGVIDPIDELAEVAAREGAWFHVDAAWGGGAAFVPELRAALGGIEKADSITFDAHKWLSAPMGAGLYLTRHPEILKRTFDVLAPTITQNEIIESIRRS